MRQDNLLIPSIMILMMILFCLCVLKHQNSKCSQICCVCVCACVFSRKSIGFQPAGFRSVLYQWSLLKLDTTAVTQLFLKKIFPFLDYCIAFTFKMAYLFKILSTKYQSVKGKQFKGGRGTLHYFVNMLAI